MGALEVLEAGGFNPTQAKAIVRAAVLLGSSASYSEDSTSLQPLALESSVASLQESMAGVEKSLQESVAGVEKSLQESLAGVQKSVDALSKTVAAQGKNGESMQLCIHIMLAMLACLVASSSGPGTVASVLAAVCITVMAKMPRTHLWN
jgi:hypothetical protein